MSVVRLFAETRPARVAVGGCARGDGRGARAAWLCATSCPAYNLNVQGRSEMLIDTGLEYRPGDPVRVRVVRREHRISVTDDGAAIVYQAVLEREE
jgi:hypothetical protein